VSLRSRLILSIMAIMMVAIALSAVSVVLNGRRQVHTELSTALIVSQASVISSLGLIREPRSQLEVAGRLVRTFNSSRNIEASLVASDGQILMRSVPYVTNAPAPAWLVRLLTPALAPISFPLRDTGNPSATLVLRAVAPNESSEVWANVTNYGLFVLLFFIPALFLIWWTSDWILSPLSRLAAGMAELRAGQGDALVKEQGPRELRALTAAFNHLVEELSARAVQAARLESQLTRIQAEERADIARDLHDDIGPLLFLAKIDLASLTRHPSLHVPKEIRETASGVVGHLSQIQTSLRDILNRLQPHRELGLSLVEVTEHSLTHWRVRYPDVVFQLDADHAPSSLPPVILDAASRVIAESISNAFQHAKLSYLSISLAEGVTGSLEITVRNDGLSQQPAKTSGFGLRNMRDRVEACGGQFTSCHDAETSAWTIQAVMPLSWSPKSHRAAAA
jgi:two-component system, NarL family, sensor histidine kinase UhpB